MGKIGKNDSKATREPSQEETDASRLRVEIYHMLLSNANNTLAAHLASITSFATLAIQGVFLLNGAAAVAALTANNIDSAARLHILKIGAWGAVCAIFCAGVSYVAQRLYMQIDLRRCQEFACRALGEPVENPTFIDKDWIRSLALGLAIVLFIASLSMFIYGLSLLPPLFLCAIGPI